MIATAETLDRACQNVLNATGDFAVAITHARTSDEALAICYRVRELIHALRAQEDLALDRSDALCGHS